MIEGLKTPRWYWVVAGLSCLWNAFGCLDYTMTATRNAAYLSAFPPEMIEYIDSFPFWLMICWALGTWGALAGSILLLARSRLAIVAFLVSLFGLFVTTVYQALDTRPEGVEQTGADTAITAVIWAIAVFLLWFSVRMRARGILR